MKTGFHKILVPVDFSPCSLEAYRAAAALARDYRGELIVLHVVDLRLLKPLTESPSLKAESIKKVLQKKAQQRLRALSPKQPSKVNIRRIITTGIPFQEIVRTARQKRADLIVMGRYGGTGEMEKIFFGSTAEKVVRLASCAVLSIPLIVSGTRRASRQR